MPLRPPIKMWAFKKRTWPPARFTYAIQRNCLHLSQNVLNFEWRVVSRPVSFGAVSEHAEPVIIFCTLTDIL